MNSQGGIAFIILAWTAALSVGQALALRVSGPRTIAHLVAWVVATAVAIALAFMLFGKQRDAANLVAETKFLWVLAGFINAVALWAGARWGAARGAEEITLGQQLTRLIGIHVGVVFAGGTIGTVLFAVFRLARVRW